MSAIEGTAPFFNVQLDGLRSYHTQIKVIVHSHNNPDPIELSDDVNSCNIAKNIKGTGRANLSIVPRINLLNNVFPNDVVNIYFNRGDGQGWTRTFFGFVDRIEEEYTVDQKGVPKSLYHLVCSDWSKVLDKTEIYNNPAFAGRTDISRDITQDGGANFAHLFKGIKLTGTPPDQVLNLLLLQLSFAEQWILPKSYRANVDRRFLELKKQYNQKRLLDTIKGTLAPAQLERLKALIESGELDQIREDNESSPNPPSEGPLTEAEEIRVLANNNSDSPEEAEALYDALTSDDFSIVSDADRFAEDIIRRVGGNDEISPDYLRAYFNAFSARGGQATPLVDLINLFDFVERRAIDGYNFDQAVWSAQGPLINILRSVSNEVMNELIFDLRPMNVGGELTIGTDWDRSPDEIKGNVSEHLEPNGIRYVPAVVMREYPFSTVHEVDATGVSLARGENTEIVGDFGILYFGAIFSNMPNKPGRHIVVGPVINLDDRASGDTGTCRKHLDVAVVSETEIQSSRLGRSDNDHFNLFEMWSDVGLGDAQRYLMKDFSPIITPEHIRRHGLRVRTVSTRFARLDITTANAYNTAPEDAEEQTEQEEEEERLEKKCIPPIKFPDGDNSFPPEAPAQMTSRDANNLENAIAHKLTFRDSGFAAWGYRPSTRGGQFWHFHNGNDYGYALITGPDPGDRVAGPPGIIDVVAIADGYVVASLPPNVSGFSGYGNYVAIEHPQFEQDGKKYISVYAHLDSRTPKVGNNRGGGSQNKRDGIAEGFHHSTSSSSNFEKIYVRRGDVIGKMGRTGMQGLGTHLHFEIAHKLPTKARGTRDIAYDQAGYDARRAKLLSDGKNNVDFYLDPGNFTPLSAGAPADPSGGAGSTDPVVFFQETALDENGNPGIDIVDAISALNPDPTPEETDVDFEEGGGEAPADDDDVAAAEATTETPEDETDNVQGERQLTSAVDSSLGRRTLGRWIIMQDHWYQHNIEYLNGQIVMRGAPEIRVGYRLDISERNMSFYVESVQHNWSYGNIMQTTLQVTRGQPNNPYPAYALPPTEGFKSQQTSRRSTSRLAMYAVVPDPIAVRRAISIRNNMGSRNNTEASENFGDVNAIDVPDNWKTNGGAFDFGELPDGLLPAKELDDSVADQVTDLTDEDIGLVSFEEALGIVDSLEEEENSSNATVDAEIPGAGNE